MHRTRRAGRLVTVVLAVLVAGRTHADTVVIERSEDVKDNTLYEDPDGSLSNGQGNYFFAGQTAQEGEGAALRRSVIAFDLRAWVMNVLMTTRSRVRGSAGSRKRIRRPREDQ